MADDTATRVLPASDGNETRTPITVSAPPGQPLPSVPGYELLERVGGGGMGVVYRARDQRLNRAVAVKLIRSGTHASANELTRFHTEAQAAAGLHHPNVVQVFEVGEADGQPYLCMEFVDGQSLADALDGTPWGGSRAARLVEPLARAMAEAHRRGVVHRDLKPSNILLPGGDDGTPKITDFGLAKLMTADRGLTQSGAFVGTPAYAPPEQAGAFGGRVGPPADVYALGAVLYELLAGRPPFTGSTVADTLRQALDLEPVPPRMLNPAVPADLEAVCLKCLEKNPARRYPTAGELADDLGRWQRHEPTHARPPGVVGRAVRWGRRHPAAVLVAGVLTAGVLGMGWQWRAAVAAGELAEQRRGEAAAAGELAEQRRQEAEQARATAEEDARVAGRVADYLGGLFDEADPFVVSGRLLDPDANPNPTAADVVARGAKQLADPDFLKSRPLVRANLLDRLGRVYVGLGEGAKGFPLVMEALDLRRKHLPADHPDLAASLHSAGFLHFARWDYATARELFTQAVDIRAKVFGEASPPATASRAYLAAVMVAAHDDQAAALLNRVLAEMKAARPSANADPRVAAQADFERCLVLLLTVAYHSRQGDRFLAATTMAELLLTTKNLPDRDLAALFPQLIEHEQLRAARKPNEAEQAARKALATMERRLGKSHFLYLRLQLVLVTELMGSDRREKAGPLLEELIALFTKNGGGGGLAEAYRYYGEWLQKAKVDTATDPQERAKLAKQVMNQYHRAIEEAKAVSNLAVLGETAAHCGQLYVDAGPDQNLALSEKYARLALDALGQEYGQGSYNTAWPRRILIHSYSLQGKLDELEMLLRDFRSQVDKREWNEQSPEALRDIARILAVAKRNNAAVMYLDEAARIRPGILDEVDTDPQFDDLRQTDDYKQLRERAKSPKK